jgi:purine catabolism regulator
VGAVTAREVLALLERRGARLVAGAAGLDRLVTWASPMHARPPAFESLQGGELALLALGTLRALRAQDDSLTLARLVTDLAERQVAAIAVVGLVSPHAHSASAMPGAPRSGIPLAAAGDQREPTAEEIALADAARLPLLALPVGTPLPEVERDVIAYVVARGATTGPPEPESPRDVYDALMRASLRGDDDRALGQRLAGLLGVAVVLEDERDVRWCALPSEFPLPREALAALLRRPSARGELRWLGTSAQPAPAAGIGASSVDREPAPPEAATPVAAHTAVRVSPLANGLLRLLTPLQARQNVAAYLSLVVARAPGAEESSTPHKTLAAFSAVLAQVAPLFALALARRHDLAGVEQRLHVESLDALLAGTYADEGQMRARAAQLGHDLARAHAALVVALNTSAEGETRGSYAELATGIAETLAASFEGTWARARGGEVTALVPLSEAPSPGMLAELAARVAETIGRTVGASGVTWSAGLGEAAIGPAALRRSHDEARAAAQLGLQVLGPRHVARADDLGIYRLLLRLRESGELEDFTRRTLGPLTADPRSGDALIETLDVFFACNGNLSEAARRLHLHRNSLIYRLGRARELLGHDLEDPETRLALQLALKARWVLAL